MLDNGATVNIIKVSALHPDVPINTERSLNTNGITSELVPTLGTARLTICRMPYNFHAVHDDFPLAENGILGRNLLIKEKAILSYCGRAVVMKGDFMNPILFLTPDERDYHLKRSQEVGPRLTMGQPPANMWNITTQDNDGYYGTYFSHYQDCQPYIEDELSWWEYTNESEQPPIQEDFIDYTYLDPYKYSPEPTGGESMHSPGEPLNHLEIMGRAPGGAEDSKYLMWNPLLEALNCVVRLRLDAWRHPKILTWYHRK